MTKQDIGNILLLLLSAIVTAVLGVLFIKNGTYTDNMVYFIGTWLISASCLAAIPLYCKDTKKPHRKKG